MCNVYKLRYNDRGITTASEIGARSLQDISAELQANYEQNVSDAIAVLPKLMTGLDVNVRFTG